VLEGAGPLVFCDWRQDIDTFIVRHGAKLLTELG